MPLTAKRSYTVKEKGEQDKNEDSENKNPTTPFSKIKTRGRSFIGSKTPTRDKSQEDMPFLSPFLRSSVRLKSFRKRKMANREEHQVDGSLNKKVFMAEKCKDEIEEKIEENIRMKDGIMKLITGCNDAKQAVDISKNLLAINSRVLSLMSSLQKKRSTSILKDYNQRQSKIGEPTDSKPSCVAEVCISDIRIPLMWKADSHFKTKVGELPTLLYHMFCLFKIGDQVYDTPLTQFNQIDTDVTFENLYIFHDVPADFRLEVEVYYTVMHNPDNPVWTPMRSQKKSVYDSAPKYCLAAHSQLTVDNIKDGFLTSDFIMGSKGASATAVLGQVDDLPENPLALWGQFSCYLRAKPSCMLKDAAEGNMYLQASNGGQLTWEKYFCRLRHCTIQCWKLSPQHEGFTMDPNISIKIKGNMEVRIEKSQFADRNVLILTSSDAEKEPVISFDNTDDLDKWYQALTQLIIDAKSWKLACEQPMKFETIATKKNLLSKPVNFYDQIHVEQSDLRPKSPRSVKKSSKQSSRIFETNSKRSFYDLIQIDEKTPKTPDTGITLVVNGDVNNDKSFYMETESNADGETILQNSNGEACIQNSNGEASLQTSNGDASLQISTSNQVTESSREPSETIFTISSEPAELSSVNNPSDECIGAVEKLASAEEGLRPCEQGKDDIISANGTEMDTENFLDGSMDVEVSDSAENASSPVCDKDEEMTEDKVELEDVENKVEVDDKATIEEKTGIDYRAEIDDNAEIDDKGEINDKAEIDDKGEMGDKGEIVDKEEMDDKGEIDDKAITEDTANVKDEQFIDETEILTESKVIKSEDVNISEYREDIAGQSSDPSNDSVRLQDNDISEIECDSKPVVFSSSCEENLQQDVSAEKSHDMNELEESENGKEDALSGSSEEVGGTVESSDNVTESQSTEQSGSLEILQEMGNMQSALEDRLENLSSDENVVKGVLVDGSVLEQTESIENGSRQDSSQSGPENVPNDSQRELVGNSVQEKNIQPNTDDHNLSTVAATIHDNANQSEDTEMDCSSIELKLSETSEQQSTVETEQLNSEINQHDCIVNDPENVNCDQPHEPVSQVPDGKIQTDV